MRREVDESGQSEAGAPEGRAGAVDAPAAPAKAGASAEPWLLGSAVCVPAAAVCLVLGYYDAAFVAGALGAVAWFLNVRSRLPSPPDGEDDEADEGEE